MFKAISRFGSQVRSTIGIGFISNLFGSKSKQKYGEFNDETEEIFSDAHEELDSDSESMEEQTTVIVETPNTKLDIVPSNCDSINHNKESKPDEICVDTTNGEIVLDTIHKDSDDSSADDVDNATEESTTVDVASHTTCDFFIEENKSSDVNICDIGTPDNTTEHNKEPTYDEHQTKDGSQLVKSSPKSNGMSTSSSSSSVFKKVHRRVSSYTQRQYAKFDNIQDDENDNKVSVEVEEKTNDADENKTNNEQVEHDEIHDDDDHLFTPEKKTKKKKKVPLFSYIRGFFRRNNK